jgi:hypothetical protein
LGRVRPLHRITPMARASRDRSLSGDLPRGGVERNVPHFWAPSTAPWAPSAERPRMPRGALRAKNATGAGSDHRITTATWMIKRAGRRGAQNCGGGRHQRSCAMRAARPAEPLELTSSALLQPGGDAPDGLAGAARMGCWSRGGGDGAVRVTGVLNALMLRSYVRGCRSGFTRSAVPRFGAATATTPAWEQSAPRILMRLHDAAAASEAHVQP